MKVSDALQVLRGKLARRRYLNGHTDRRRLCVSPPPRKIGLTFTEAEALVALLESLEGIPSSSQAMKE